MTPEKPLKKAERSARNKAEWAAFHAVLIAMPAPHRRVAYAEWRKQTDARRADELLARQALKEARKTTPRSVDTFDFS